MATVGDVEDTLQVVRDTLRSGMSDSDRDWYVKTWHIHNPLVLDMAELPLGIVVSDGPSRRDQYVQEDTQVIPMTIFYFPARVDDQSGIARANRQTAAMIDRTSDLLRVDPSLGGRFYDCQVVGSVPRQPGYVGNSTYAGAEVKLEAKRRRPWRID